MAELGVLEAVDRMLPEADFVIMTARHTELPPGLMLWAGCSDEPNWVPPKLGRGRTGPLADLRGRAGGRIAGLPSTLRDRPLPKDILCGVHAPRDHHPHGAAFGP